MFRRATEQPYRAFEQPISQLHGIAYDPGEDIGVHGARDSQNNFVFDGRDMREVLDAAHRGGYQQARRQLLTAPAAPVPVPVAPADADGGGNPAAKQSRYEAFKLACACATAGCALTAAVLDAVPDVKSNCSASGAAVGCSLKHGMALGQVIAAGLGATGAWFGAATEIVRTFVPRPARDRYDSWKLGFVCLGAGCALAGASLGAVPALKADCGASGAAMGCGLAQHLAIGKVVIAGSAATVAYVGAALEFVRAVFKPRWLEERLA